MAQWDNVLRLTTSVRTGTVRASLMLKRLGAYLWGADSNLGPDGFRSRRGMPAEWPAAVAV